MTARRVRAPVCIISITYIATLDAIDAAMPRHVAWLDKGYQEGLFLASGRKVPRDGGIILVRGHAAEVEALAASDPFLTERLATAQVTEFTASMASDAIADLFA